MGRFNKVVIWRNAVNRFSLANLLKEDAFKAENRIGFSVAARSAVRRTLSRV